MDATGRHHVVTSALFLPADALNVKGPTSGDGSSVIELDAIFRSPAAVLHDAATRMNGVRLRQPRAFNPGAGLCLCCESVARIMKVMRAKRSVTHRELQKLVGASRAGTAVWERAIAGLRRDRRIAVVDEAGKAGQKKKVVKLLKQRE
jgi:hypothetical protein